MKFLFQQQKTKRKDTNEKEPQTEAAKTAASARILGLVAETWREPNRRTAKENARCFGGNGRNAKSKPNIQNGDDT